MTAPKRLASVMAHNGNMCLLLWHHPINVSSIEYCHKTMTCMIQNGIYFILLEYDHELYILVCTCLYSYHHYLFPGANTLNLASFNTGIHNLLVKPGVHTNDFAPIHGRCARIHTAPAEDYTSNQRSAYCFPQVLCE